MASTDARPFPLKNTAFRVTFPLLDADGDLVTAAGSLDSEVSLDGAAFADCTNEATEIGSTGMYYLDLTSAEMNADTVAIIVKSAGAKTTPIVLYPVEGGDIDVDVTYIAGSAVSTSSAQLGVNVVNAGGTAWGSGAITAASIATGAIDADALATDAVTEIANGITIPTAAAIADAVWDEATTGHVTAGTFGEQVKSDIDAILEDTGTTLQAEVDGIQADTEDIQSRLPAALVSGRMDASVGAMAANTLTAAALAADAVTEIQGGLSTLDAAGIRTAVGLASANLDTQLAAIDDFLDTEVAAIKAKTDNLPADPADASDIAAAFVTVNGKLDTIDDFLDTEIGAIKTVTDAIGTTGTGLTAIPWNAAWDAEVQSEVQDVLDSTIADSVPADGSRPNIPQALYMLVQLMTEKAVSGTTVTVKKPDGSTTLLTLTLDDATNPTSITRS